MKTANGSQMCCSKQIEIDGRTWGQYLYALSGCRGTAASDAYSNELQVVGSARRTNYRGTAHLPGSAEMSLFMSCLYQLSINLHSEKEGMQRINYNNLAENPGVIETTEKRLPKIRLPLPPGDVSLEE